MGPRHRPSHQPGWDGTRRGDETAKEFRDLVTIEKGREIGDVAYWAGDEWKRIEPGTDGQILTSNGANEAPAFEENLGASSTGGTVSAIDISGLSGVQGAWNMEGNLLDRGPNVLPLTLTSGPAVKFASLYGKKWLYRSLSTNVQRGQFDAALAIVGAFTGHQLAIMTPRSVGTGASEHLFGYGLGGASSGNNVLYSLRTDGAAHPTLETFHERGSGSNEGPHNFGVAANAFPTLYTLTRSSDGLDYILYINGVLVDSQSATTIADGGANGEFSLNLQDDVNQAMPGYVGDTVIQNETMVAADILAIAKQVGVA